MAHPGPNHQPHYNGPQLPPVAPSGSCTINYNMPHSVTNNYSLPPEYLRSVMAQNSQSSNGTGSNSRNQQFRANHNHNNYMNHNNFSNGNGNGSGGSNGFGQNTNDSASGWQWNNNNNNNYGLGGYGGSAQQFREDYKDDSMAEMPHLPLTQSKSYAQSSKSTISLDEDATYNSSISGLWDVNHEYNQTPSGDLGPGATSIGHSRRSSMSSVRSRKTNKSKSKNKHKRSTSKKLKKNKINQMI